MLISLRKAVLILALTIIPVLAIWMPFFFGVKSIWGIPLTGGGMAAIVRNYDGPLYIVVAKTLYNPELIKQNFSFNLPVEYYAAHFPLFPALIRVFAAVVRSYPYSMLLVTLMGSFLSLFYFHKFAEKFVDKENALWLTVIFAVFPARWLIVRSVGSPEPLFVGAIIASMYYFLSKKYFLAAIFGVISQMTKSPGILLFVAYFLAVIAPALKHAASTSSKNILQKLNLKAYPVLLIPLSLLFVFFIFKFTLNDFFAYFHSGDNIHLFFPPFQIFNYSQPWVGTFWLEEIIFVYLLSFMGLVQLIKQKRYEIAYFVGIFLTSIVFVSHRDLIRYALPIIPFLIAGYSDVLVKKEFKIVFLILLIPIYLFSLAYISQNHMQISDWAPLL